MSYYLEQLQKKSLALSKEQQDARKALKLPKIPSMRKEVNSMRIKMDDLIKKEMERRR